MKKILLLPLVGFSCLVHAQAPVLSSANYSPVVGETFTFHVHDVSTFSPGASGAGVTWDFSGLVSAGTSTQNYLDPASTPYASSFSGSTVAISDPIGYGYYKSTTSAFQNMGGANTAGTSIPAFTDLEDLMRFPFTYGDSYTDSYFGAFTTSGFPTVRSGSTTVTADAYGTLILPSGTYANVLRIHLVQDYQDSMNFGSPFITTYDTDIYSWVLPGTHSALLSKTSFSINGSSTSETGFFMDATSVSASPALEEVAQWTVCPNPATDAAFVSLDLAQASDVQMRLLDLAGHSLHCSEATQLPAGGHFLPIPLSSLSSGIYLVRLQVNGQSETQKLTVF
jgi:hypothetical protein